MYLIDLIRMMKHTFPIHINPDRMPHCSISSFIIHVYIHGQVKENNATFYTCIE